MAKVIVDIPDEMWDILQIGQYQMGYAEYVARYVEKGKLIPSDATNGDVIKALFPDVNVYGCSGYAHPSDKSSVLLEHMSSDWWNTPYKKGVDNAGCN